MRMEADPRGITDLSIEVELEGDTHRLLLEGELDLRSASRLTGLITRLCADGARHVVVDVGRVQFIDSTGLHAILASRAICEENHCAFSVAPAQDRTQVGRLLELTGLAGRLPFARWRRRRKRAGG